MPALAGATADPCQAAAEVLELTHSDLNPGIDYQIAGGDFDACATIAENVEPGLHGGPAGCKARLAGGDAFAAAATRTLPHDDTLEFELYLSAYEDYADASSCADAIRGAGALGEATIGEAGVREMREIGQAGSTGKQKSRLRLQHFDFGRLRF